MKMKSNSLHSMGVLAFSWPKIGGIKKCLNSTKVFSRDALLASLWIVIWFGYWHETAWDWFLMQEMSWNWLASMWIWSWRILNYRMGEVRMFAFARKLGWNSRLPCRSTRIIIKKGEWTWNPQWSCSRLLQLFTSSLCHILVDIAFLVGSWRLFRMSWLTFTWTESILSIAKTACLHLKTPYLAWNKVKIWGFLVWKWWLIWVSVFVR